ncbi:hypothetical protein AAG906_037848 [Vitis piasezkii]
MRKIWHLEDKCIKLRTISHDGNQGAKSSIHHENFAHLKPKPGWESSESNGAVAGDGATIHSNLCMPYWIRDQEGRLVRIENPQDTELDICVNIMDPPPEDQNSQQGQGVHPRASCPLLSSLVIRPHIVSLLPTFHGVESENPYSHIKEFEEVYMEAINACPHHGFDTWLLVSYFYDGMSSSMKQILETMSMDFLSYVAEVSRGWDEPNSREKGKFPLNKPKIQRLECTC